MNKSEKDQAAHSFSLSLESTTFLFVEPVLGEPRQGEAGNFSGISLDFTGEKSGSMWVWFSMDFATEATRNMLGLDPSEEVLHDKVMDALGEILNISTGHFLTEFFGEDQIFDLGTPRNLNPALFEESAAEGRWLMVEEFPVLVGVELE